MTGAPKDRCSFPCRLLTQHRRAAGKHSQIVALWRGPPRRRPYWRRTERNIIAPQRKRGYQFHPCWGAIFAKSSRRCDSLRSYAMLVSAHRGQGGLRRFATFVVPKYWSDLSADRDRLLLPPELVYALVTHLFGRGKMAMTTSVLSVRVSEEERALLEAASDHARTSLSDFVRRRALEAAEMDMLEPVLSSQPRTGRRSRRGPAVRRRRSPRSRSSRAPIPHGGSNTAAAAHRNRRPQQIRLRPGLDEPLVPASRLGQSRCGPSAR
ncbi:DUF1778 domain-containing protein [Mesorhizobium sp.]|uniref:type II toxin-antitoxin system TacA family antitoxin n=2 Tax=Mesorhizobium sp. TaxID=1871066 RepID=UPI00338DF999